MTALIPKEAFEQGILSEEYHERLLANMEQYTKVASVIPHFLWESLAQYCGVEEVEWVKGAKKPTTEAGLLIVNKQSIPIEDKMMAMAAAFMRNYMDARVMVLQDVLDHLDNRTMPEPTVLLIPNFCLDGKEGSTTPWKVSGLLGMLYSRHTKNLKTVLYAPKIETIAAIYGKTVADHVVGHYKIIGESL